MNKRPLRRVTRKTRPTSRKIAAILESLDAAQRWINMWQLQPCRKCFGNEHD